VLSTALRPIVRVIGASSPRPLRLSGHTIGEVNGEIGREEKKEALAHLDLFNEVSTLRIAI